MAETHNLNLGGVASTLTAFDGFGAELVNAMADVRGYRDFIGEDENGNPIPNPRTRAEFVIDQTVDFWWAVMVQKRIKDSIATAKSTQEATNDVDRGNISVT